LNKLAEDESGATHPLLIWMGWWRAETFAVS